MSTYIKMMGVNLERHCRKILTVRDRCTDMDTLYRFSCGHGYGYSMEAWSPRLF